MVAQATGGGMHLTGTGDAPLRAGLPIGDLGGGLMATIGVLAALQARHTTGRGQHVDISMQDVQISLLGYMATMYLLSGREPPAVGNGHFVHVPYNSYPAADGHLILAIVTDASWLRLLAALELPDLDTPDRRRQPGRLRDRREIDAAISAKLATLPRSAWFDRLRAADIPCAPVHSVAEALADPQVLARDMVVDVPHPGGRLTRQPGNPIKLSDTPGDTYAAPPLVGMHNEEIYGDLLGLDEPTRRSLRARGVI
jgi:CoA:oxalate CoA-transferase